MIIWLRIYIIINFEWALLCYKSLFELKESDFNSNMWWISCRASRADYILILGFLHEIWGCKCITLSHFEKGWRAFCTLCQHACLKRKWTDDPTALWLCLTFHLFVVVLVDNNASLLFPLFSKWRETGLLQYTVGTTGINTIFTL